MSGPCGKRVLIVEDDPDVRLVIVGVLAFDGHDCAEAQDTAEAVAQCLVFDPDVVILDLVLGGRERGTDFLAWYAQQTPKRARIIVVSATPLDMLITVAQDPLVAATLAKPFDIDELLKLVAGTANSSAAHADTSGLLPSSSY